MARPSSKEKGRLPSGKYSQPEQALRWIHLGSEMSLERSQRQQAADHCTASPMGGLKLTWRFRQKTGAGVERYLKSGSGHAFAKKRLWPVDR
jgi:hypothetical protein